MILKGPISRVLPATVVFLMCLQSDAEGGYSVLEYGAAGDGRANDAAAIQKAIDACHEAGGGVVILPGRRTYLCGMIQLRSNVDLHVERGATLRGVTDRDLYGRERALIVARDCNDVSITGLGTIDGDGLAWMNELEGDIFRAKSGRPSWQGPGPNHRQARHGNPSPCFRDAGKLTKDERTRSSHFLLDVPARTNHNWARWLKRILSVGVQETNGLRTPPIVQACAPWAAETTNETMREKLRFTGEWPPVSLLDQYPNWEYALDEEGVEGQDETTIRPESQQKMISENTAFMATRAKQANGTEHIAIVAIVAGRIDAVDVFTNERDAWCVERNGNKWESFIQTWLPVDERMPHVLLSDRNIFPLRVVTLLPTEATGYPLTEEIS